MRVLAEVAGDLVAVHVRQPDVQQDRMRVEPGCPFEGVGAVMGHATSCPHERSSIADIRAMSWLSSTTDTATGLRSLSGAG